MIVITLVGFLEPAFTAKSDYIVFNREIEVLLFHSRKFSLQHDLILVFIDIYAWSPGTATDSLVPEGASHVRGKESIYFFLKSAQISKRVVPYDSHKAISSLIDIP